MLQYKKLDSEYNIIQPLRPEYIESHLPKTRKSAH
jgi:hypothetical protein